MVVVYLFGNVEMKAGEYGAGGFAKFGACCSSCKFEKLLPLVIGGGDSTVVKVVLVIAVVILPNPFVGTIVTIFCMSSRD